MKHRKFKWKTFLVCIAIPVGAGFLSALLNISAFSLYKQLTKPPFSPPSVMFPIVWTALYLLMGISCYLIAAAGAETEDSRSASENTSRRTYTQEKRMDALFTYGIQLFVNLLWPILFFNQQAFLLAFVWLLFLWVLVLRMICQFDGIHRFAAYLQIPYLLWCTFAAYLNLAIYLLNP